MKTTVLLAVFAVGCAGGPSDWDEYSSPERTAGTVLRKQCAIECLGSFHAEMPVDCNVVEMNFNIARQLLTTAWDNVDARSWPFDPETGYSFADGPEDFMPSAPLIPPSQYCKAMGSLNVTMKADSAVFCPTPKYPEPWKTGCYNVLAGGAFTDWYGGALGHEMLHHWDWTQGVLDTGNHTDWDTNGRTAASTAYRFFSEVP